MKQLKIIVILCLISIATFAAGEWITFTSAPGKFKLSFPRQPKATSERVKKSGLNIVMNMFLYEVGKFKDDNAVYMAMYCDYPDTLINSDFKEELVDTVFMGAISSMTEQLQGTVLSSEAITYKDFPGKKAKISSKEMGGVAYIKVYLVHSRLYMLLVACDAAKDNNASINRFFNSFVITGIK